MGLIVNPSGVNNLNDASLYPPPLEVYNNASLYPPPEEEGKPQRRFFKKRLKRGTNCLFLTWFDLPKVNKSLVET